MDWVFLIVSVILCCEIFLRIPLLAEASVFLNATGRIFSIVQSAKISDHWKEKAIPKYAFKAAASSIRFLLYVIAVGSPIVLFLVVDQYSGTDFSQLLIGLPAIAFSLVLAIVYLKIRKR